MNIQVRWLINRDLPEVLAIENKCFDCPWDEDEFRSTLRARNTIGMVAELNGDDIVGYMVYELSKLSDRNIRILNFAVDPAYQRQGIGTAMIDRLKDKLSTQRRKALWTIVGEWNLDAQLFFAEMGFRAVDVLRGYFEEPEGDAYEMRYLLKPVETVFHSTHPNNRISQYEGGVFDADD